jgi:transcriptional regulator with XRE-family HTH domain
MPDVSDNGQMPFNYKAIRPRREKLGLTQQECADAAGFPNLQKWSNYENGRVPDPQLSTLEAIAKALKWSVKNLIS